MRGPFTVRPKGADRSLRRLMTRIGVAVLLGAAALPAPAAAQSTTGETAVQLLERVFSATLFSPDGNPQIPRADFERRTQDSIDGIATGIGIALSSFPLGAASAGFSYRTDPNTGEQLLRSVSFGSVFVDRALTAGKGKVNLGFSFQRGSYDVLQGLDIKNDGFVVQNQLGTYVREGSMVGDIQTAFLDVDANVFTFAGSIGVTDSFDIGWVIPFADLTLNARSVRIYNGGLDWDDDLPGVRAAYPGKTGEQITIDETISKTGVGDVIVRAKYAFNTESANGVAVSGDLRLPTGDEDNLLGSGEAAFKLSLAATRAVGASTSVHGYAGYTFGGFTDEFNYGVAADFAVLSSKKLTLSGEFFGRNLRDTISGSNVLPSFDGVLGAPPARPRRVIVDYGFWERGSSNLLRSAFSARYQIGGTWLLTGSVQFRLNDNGYQSKFTPFIGVEHTFGGK